MPVTNHWLRLFGDEEHNRHAWELFCSLLNASVAYDPVGWGIPYNYLISSGVAQENYSEMALQVLLVFLDRSRAGEDAHLFRVYLRSLGQENSEELNFLLDRLTALLSNPLDMQHTFFPSSGRTIENSKELTMLLWTLLSGSQVCYLSYYEVQGDS